MKTIFFKWGYLKLWRQRINALMAARDMIREAELQNSEALTEDLAKKYDDLINLIGQIIIFEAASISKEYFTLTPDDLETYHQ